MNSSSASAPLGSRLRICHALLDYVGAQVGIRVLHIKGVTIDADLAVGRHSSTDCDVLVHPDDVHSYIQALENSGWELRTHFEHGSVFGHAVTMYHQVWGTVDVHRNFPGIASDAAGTFEKWWADRRAIELGGATVHTLSPIDQRVLLLLHAARNGETPRNHDFNTTWVEASEPERRALEKRVIELGGRTPLMILTDDGDGTRRRTVMNEPNFQLWDATIRGANATEVWRAQLLDAKSPWEKIQILWKAMHVNRDHLGIQLGRVPTRRDVSREWVNRLGRGARRLLRMRGTTGGSHSAG